MSKWLIDAKAKDQTSDLQGLGESGTVDKETTLYQEDHLGTVSLLKYLQARH